VELKRKLTKTILVPQTLDFAQTQNFILFYFIFFHFSFIIHMCIQGLVYL
jgi:hypothetical protein